MYRLGVANPGSAESPRAGGTSHFNMLSLSFLNDSSRNSVKETKVVPQAGKDIGTAAS